LGNALRRMSLENRSKLAALGGPDRALPLTPKDEVLTRNARSVVFALEKTQPPPVESESSMPLFQLEQACFGLKPSGETCQLAI
jgi:hypothetical protein